MLHKYAMNGYYIVIDVNSGAVHTLDEIAFNILDFYKKANNEEMVSFFKDKYSENDILETIAELEALESDGILFSEDIYEEMASNIAKRKPVVKALCLHIAHDCNLKCTYCFAEEGEYGGCRSLMSAEVGKKAIDFLIQNSANRKNLEIDFFGGEPLMNFDVVKELVTYGREQEKRNNKNFRFTLTTNGILLNEEIGKYLNENMHNVVLSLDGRKEVNDNMRKTVTGKGSYDIIVPKYQHFSKSRKQQNYYVRGTFTHENLDFSEDVMHMADLGFSQVSIEPVVSFENNKYVIKAEDVPIICEEYEKLAVSMLERARNEKGFNFFHFMIDLTGGPCITKRLAGCGAGTEYLAVTPQGELYPCHQFVGQTHYKMGNVDMGVTNHERFKEFDHCHIYSKEECKKCWAKFYCSGGCSANAFQANGNILKPYKIGCDLLKKRTECAIMMVIDKAFSK